MINRTRYISCLLDKAPISLDTSYVQVAVERAVLQTYALLEQKLNSKLQDEDTLVV